METLSLGLAFKLPEVTKETTFVLTNFCGVTIKLDLNTCISTLGVLLL